MFQRLIPIISYLTTSLKSLMQGQVVLYLYFSLCFYTKIFYLHALCRTGPHGRTFLNSSACISIFEIKQGKSEGFESCDRPIVRKRPVWVKIGDVLYRVTLKFDGWPRKTIEHLSIAVSNFVQHFIAIGKFKLELQSGNAQFGSNSTIFRAGWPWNLTYDLEKQ